MYMLGKNHRPVLCGLAIGKVDNAPLTSVARIQEGRLSRVACVFRTTSKCLLSACAGFRCDREAHTVDIQPHDFKVGFVPQCRPRAVGNAAAGMSGRFDDAAVPRLQSPRTA